MNRGLAEVEGNRRRRRSRPAAAGIEEHGGGASPGGGLRGGVCACEREKREWVGQRPNQPDLDPRIRGWVQPIRPRDILVIHQIKLSQLK